MRLVLQLIAASIVAGWTLNPAVEYLAQESQLMGSLPKEMLVIISDFVNVPPLRLPEEIPNLPPLKVHIASTRFTDSELRAVYSTVSSEPFLLPSGIRMPIQRIAHFQTQSGIMNIFGESSNPKWLNVDQTLRIETNSIDCAPKIMNPRFKYREGTYTYPVMPCRLDLSSGLFMCTIELSRKQHKALKAKMRKRDVHYDAMYLILDNLSTRGDACEYKLHRWERVLTFDSKFHDRSGSTMLRKHIRVLSSIPWY